MIFHVGIVKKAIGLHSRIGSSVALAGFIIGFLEGHSSIDSDLHSNCFDSIINHGV
jgi:hypothetical protein